MSKLPAGWEIIKEPSLPAGWEPIKVAPAPGSIWQKMREAPDAVMAADADVFMRRVRSEVAREQARAYKGAPIKKEEYKFKDLKLPKQPSPDRALYAGPHGDVGATAYAAELERRRFGVPMAGLPELTTAQKIGPTAAGVGMGVATGGAKSLLGMADFFMGGGQMVRDVKTGEIIPTPLGRAIEKISELEAMSELPGLTGASTVTEFGLPFLVGGNIRMPAMPAARKMPFKPGTGRPPIIPETPGIYEKSFNEWALRKNAVKAAREEKAAFVQREIDKMETKYNNLSSRLDKVRARKAALEAKGKARDLPEIESLNTEIQTLKEQKKVAGYQLRKTKQDYLPIEKAARESEYVLPKEVPAATPKQFPKKEVPAATEITDAELNAALGREPKPIVTREAGFVAMPEPGALAEAASRAGKAAVEVGRIFGSTTEQGLHPNLASNLRLSYARTRNLTLQGVARQRWIQDIKGQFRGTNTAERNNAFDLAESFRLEGGEPAFGARERALNPEALQDDVMSVLKREYGQQAGPIGDTVLSMGLNTTPEGVAQTIIQAGADLTPNMAKALDKYRLRYTPEQSAAMWEKASPKERDLAMWWRIKADETMQRNPWIRSDIEAYVHHAFTTTARKAWINAVNSPLMKRVTPGWTKFRKGVEGYSRDLRRVALEYFPEVEAEAIRRNFMAELERAYTEPTFKVPQKNMVKYTAEFALELKGKEFSLPEVFVKKLRMDKSEFIDYLVDPAAQSEMMAGMGHRAARRARQLSALWRLNALAYAPQTYVTNMLGGLSQIGLKNLHDVADLVGTSVIKPSEMPQKARQLFYDLWAIPAAAKEQARAIAGRKTILTREMLGENITREGLEGKGITEQVLSLGMAPMSWEEDFMRRVVYMSEAGWKTRKIARGIEDGTATAEELTMHDNARAMVDKFIFNYKTNPKYVNALRDSLLSPFMSYVYHNARMMTGELPIGAKMVSRAQNPVRFRGKALNSGEALEVYQRLVQKRGASRGLTNAERDAIAQYNTVVGKQAEGLPLTEADSALLARNEKLINEKGGWFGLNKEEWDFIRDFKSRDVREKIAGTIALGAFLYGIAEWRERGEKADPSGVAGNPPGMPWELSTAGRVYVGRKGDTGVYFKANKYNPILYASADGLRALGYLAAGRGNRASAILGDASEEFISEQLNAGPSFETAAAIMGFGNKYQAGTSKAARLGAVGASFIPGQRVTSQIARLYEAANAPKSFTDKYGMPQYRRDTFLSALTQNIPVVSQETKGRLKLYPSGEPKGLKRDIWAKRAIWGVNVTEVSLSERMKWAKENAPKILANDWIRNYIRVKYPFKADIPAMRKEYSDEELNRWIAGTGEALTVQERAVMKMDMRQKLLKWQGELAKQ